MFFQPSPNAVVRSVDVLLLCNVGLCMLHCFVDIFASLCRCRCPVVLCLATVQCLAYCACGTECRHLIAFDHMLIHLAMFNFTAVQQMSQTSPKVKKTLGQNLLVV